MMVYYPRYILFTLVDNGGFRRKFCHGIPRQPLRQRSRLKRAITSELRPKSSHLTWVTQVSWLTWSRSAFPIRNRVIQPRRGRPQRSSSSSSRKSRPFTRSSARWTTSTLATRSADAFLATPCRSCENGHFLGRPI